MKSGPKTDAGDCDKHAESCRGPGNPCILRIRQCRCTMSVRRVVADMLPARTLHRENIANHSVHVRSDLGFRQSKRIDAYIVNCSSELEPFPVTPSADVDGLTRAPLGT